MQIAHLDHLVLTVTSIDASIQFYTQALGMEAITFGIGRQVLTFGQQKINLHQSDHTFEPKAQRPTPGSADLCFIVLDDLDEVVAHLTRLGIAIVDGPIRRTGATGPILSVYVRDPDLNLIELSRPL
ncbi:MAG: VOC family protein [Neisseriaceae bacterium]|nr:VOC family protein [Neisseriaceae bacterium]